MLGQERLFCSISDCLCAAGLDQFEELPLTSAKTKTTFKKPRERAAFFDVTNADQSLPGDDSFDSIKNLADTFTPAKVSVFSSESHHAR